MKTRMFGAAVADSAHATNRSRLLASIKHRIVDERPPTLDAIAIFAKAAAPGRVKTRLQPPLTPEQAAAFHAACVRDVHTRLAASGSADVWIFSDQPWPSWIDLAGPGRFGLQRGDDLGERMRRCFEDLRAAGAGRMAIVGSDSPTLPAQLIEAALAALVSPEDASLISTEDGGYCLIGCREPRDLMFSGVEWSTERTLAQTELSLEATGYRVSRLDRWYDVDVAADLERLRADEDLGPHVRQWFSESFPSR